VAWESIFRNFGWEGLRKNCGGIGSINFIIYYSYKIGVFLLLSLIDLSIKSI